MPDFEIPIYVESSATVKISGRSIPSRSGRCAFYILNQGIAPEFFCIGANANNQTMKSMGVLMYLVEREGKASVAFQPRRFRIDLEDKVTHIKRLYDVTVWKTVVIPAAS
jgi:stage V sporulation protein SpoVS